MVKEGHDFVVYDAKSGEDLTRQVLTQIIVDQESKDNQENLLPTSFLKQLIGFYGDNVQTVLPSYLEQTLEAFAKNQERFQELFPVSTFEEVSRQNMAMFENAMTTSATMPASWILAIIA